MQNLPLILSGTALLLNLCTMFLVLKTPFLRGPRGEQGLTGPQGMTGKDGRCCCEVKR